MFGAFLNTLRYLHFTWLSQFKCRNINFWRSNLKLPTLQTRHVRTHSLWATFRYTYLCGVVKFDLALFGQSTKQMNKKRTHLQTLQQTSLEKKQSLKPDRKEGKTYCSFFSLSRLSNKIVSFLLYLGIPKLNESIALKILEEKFFRFVCFWETFCFQVSKAKNKGWP